MIKTSGLTKKFGDFTALCDFTTSIPDGTIYGLVGSNGSGKSTLLRLISGIYAPDAGSIEVGGAPPFENPQAKQSVFHVSDDLYFLPQCTMDDMAKFYKSMYAAFDAAVYREMCGRFPIDPKKRVNTFSKGMKRQAALILALACRPQALLLDEAFDGLDPVIRGALRKILADEMLERGMSVVIASHNLRELEDLCDYMGLLHQGRVVFERDIDAVKLGFCKVQAGFKAPPGREAFSALDIMQFTEVGSVINLIVRGNAPDVLEQIGVFGPMFAESVPLTLEEVFIYEMEAVGYDYNRIVF